MINTARLMICVIPWITMLCDALARYVPDLDELSPFLLMAGGAMSVVGVAYGVVGRHPKMALLGLLYVALVAVPIMMAIASSWWNANLERFMRPTYLVLCWPFLPLIFWASSDVRADSTGLQGATRRLDRVPIVSTVSVVAASSSVGLALWEAYKWLSLPATIVEVERFPGGYTQEVQGKGLPLLAFGLFVDAALVLLFAYNSFCSWKREKEVARLLEQWSAEHQAPSEQINDSSPLRGHLHANDEGSGDDVA